MIRLHVERQPVGGAGPLSPQTPLQLPVQIALLVLREGLADVRVPPHNHILLLLPLQPRIQRVPRLHVMRPRLHMVMIPIDPESAFKHRLLPILLHHYPRPPNIRPLRTLMMLQPRLAFEHPILHPVHGHLAPQGPIRRHVLYRGPIGNDIVIWRQRQLDLLLSPMQVKREIKLRKGMYAVTRGAEFCILDKRIVRQRVSLIRVCCH